MKTLSTLCLFACLAACSQTSAESASPGVTSELSIEAPDSEETNAPAFLVTDVDTKAGLELIASDKNLIVLDIRTPEEFEAGHIEGAINIDFRSPEFGAGLDGLDKSKSYLMHCRSGGRSTSALPMFEERAFTNIYHLNKGYSQWEAQ